MPEKKQPSRKAKTQAPSTRTRSRKGISSARLHPVTFCTSCGDAIPLKAITCFHCGAKQANPEQAIQVVFCEKCGKDYPARAMACFHCGHLNPHHPVVKGRITR